LISIKDLGHELIDGRGDASQGDLAGQTVRRIGYVQQRLIEIIEHLPSATEKGAARRAEFDTPRGSVEEAHAQAGLQLDDASGQCRLGEMELPRSRREAAQLCHGDKGA